MSTIAVSYRPASKDANFCCNKRELVELRLGNLIPLLDAGIFVEAPEIDAINRSMLRDLREICRTDLKNLSGTVKG